MADPDVQLTPTILSEGLGAFDAVEVLGNGTYGTTFRVVRGDDEYAVKVIHLPDLPEHLWEREVAALEAVEHPNVVRFRTSGNFVARDREFLYLECEYVPGGTLRSALADGRTITDAAALRAFLTGLLAGVCEIHDLGIHHRDIKPENIALRHGDWGEPVLLDFGLAKVVGMSSHTMYPRRIGTAAYMSPEQLLGKRARSRSDLFAVGVVAFEAGTGQHPFLEPGVSTTFEDLVDVIRDGPPDPRNQSDWWPNEVAEVVMRLLSYHPHSRLGVERALEDLEEPT